MEIKFDVIESSSRKAFVEKVESALNTGWELVKITTPVKDSGIHYIAFLKGA